MKNRSYLNLVKKSNRAYSQAAKKYGPGPQAVFWGDQQSQYFRFFELLKFIDWRENHVKILDIGCGNGELYKFLNFLGFKGTYVGYDINADLIKQARQRFPKIDFQVKDVCQKKTKTKFDYVLCSGLFNLNLGQSLTLAEKMISEFFALANEALVFNMISTWVNLKEKKIYYADPAKIFNFCVKNLSPRVSLTHHNLPYNFTVAIFKGRDWHSVNKK